tara:strand:+ start:157 stop:327 length:171 start_codon:yes stop_codon:yes gene_type:complete
MDEEQLVVLQTMISQLVRAAVLVEMYHGTDRERMAIDLRVEADKELDNYIMDNLVK